MSKAAIEELVEAASEWLRAEHSFRCGKKPYTEEKGERYFKAEKQLRRALTGKGDLSDAFMALQALGPKHTRKKKRNSK